MARTASPIAQAVAISLLLAGVLWFAVHALQQGRVQDLKAKDKKQAYIPAIVVAILVLLGRYAIAPKNKPIQDDNVKKENCFETTAIDDKKSLKVSKFRFLSKHVQYCLEFHCDGRKETRWRRYSELRDIFRTVRATLDDAGYSSYADTFPDKTTAMQYLTSGDQNDEFRRERLQSLHQFFDGLFGFSPKSLANVNRKLALEIAQVVATHLGLDEEFSSQLLATSSSSAGSNNDDSNEVKARQKSFLDAGEWALKQLFEVTKHAVGAGSDGWKKHSVNQGIDIYIKRVGDNVHSVGRGIIQAPQHAVLAMFTDSTQRAKFDDLFISERDIEMLDPDHLPRLKTFPGNPEMDFITVRHTKFKSAAPFVAPRDNLAVYACARLEDGTSLVALKSVEHKWCPPMPGNVRAEVVIAGVIIRPINATSCEMTKLEAVDAGGYVPLAVVNRLGPSRAMMIREIGKCLKDRSKWPKAPESKEDVRKFIRETFNKLNNQ